MERLCRRRHCGRECGRHRYCLLNSGIGAFDIDDCRDPETGDINPWAMELVAKAGSYTEITPSGEGLRILGYGSGEKIHRKQPVAKANCVSLESYRKAERYITITGNALPDSKVELADLDALMDATVAELDAKTKKKATTANGSGSTELPPMLSSLLHVTDAGGYPSRSELVFAFITGCLRARGQPREDCRSMP